jgi:glycosyltransferase involved in cell wall biosynthesis
MSADTTAPRDESSMRLPRIGFIGSMNAMPMTYALKFRRDGFDVRYVVESGRDNYLMRPEYQFRGEIGYPYPDWVLEIPWPNNLRHHATLPYSNRAVIQAMHDRDVIFLNDYGIALAPWMPEQALCVALSSGGDIDVWCQWGLAFRRAYNGRRKWAYPLRLPLELWRTRLQRRGLSHCRTICYFPRGLNPIGDRLISELCGPDAEQRTIERYDMDFAAAGARRAPIPRRELSVILVPVRFHLLPMPGNEGEHKGNEKILRALARYRRRRPSIRVHLFDKGPKADLELAHRLCRELGLDNCVTWHQPVSLSQLLDMYEQADVCIDQVGNHWMGAIGFHALYMGRPLIANARPDVFKRQWGDNTPILQATTEDEIFDHLIRCEDLDFRERVAADGHRFAVEHLEAEGVYQRIRSSIMKDWGDSFQKARTL